MAKNIEINIKTKADTKEVKDLQTILKDLKDVKVDVGVNTNKQELNALIEESNELKKRLDYLKKVNVGFNVHDEEIQQIESKIISLDNRKAEIYAQVRDEELAKLRAEYDNIEHETATLDVIVEGEEQLDAVGTKTESMDGDTITNNFNVEGEEELDAVQSKKEAIEDDEINVQLNNQSAMQAIDQIAEGFSKIKTAAAEVGQEFGDLLASAGKQETNFKFLENAVGNAETARQKMQEINDIVAQLPGDDTALQGLLSSAAAKDSSLTAENLKSMANSATDYFSAMSYYGKSATEAQQDMTNYLLAGNTAELERSPILQGHIDKLKEATTVQERSKALAEALNEEHWGGMGAMDTYNNKLETFNGMIERGRYTLGGMFQEGAKGGMDFLLKLDESTNGLVGMTIAASGLASPLFDAFMGLGQLAMGVNALKETKLGDWASTLKGKLKTLGSAAKTAAINIGSTLKTALVGAGNAAKGAITSIANMGKAVLTAGYNALKAAGIWLVEKAQLIASTIAKGAATVASYALAAAEWLAASPILLVVAAVVALIAVLWYLYNTNESVRDAINSFVEALQGVPDMIYGAVMGAFEWLQGAWQNTVDFFTTGGQMISDALTGAFQWIQDAFMGVVTFFQTYGPLIAQILFVMATGGIGAIVLLVANFMGMPNQVGGALQNVISRVISFVSSVVSNMVSGATRAGSSFVNGIAQLPGRVYNELAKTLDRVIQWGSQIVARLGEIAQRAWQAFVNGLGIGSPGYIQILTLKELDDTGKRVPKVAQGIVSNLSKMSEQAVQAWGTPTLTVEKGENTKLNIGNTTGLSNNNLSELLNQLSVSLNGNNNGEPTLIFNLYGDIDDDKRMEKFLNAVRKELSWNNKTAGRTV